MKRCYVATLEVLFVADDEAGDDAMSAAAFDTLESEIREMSGTEVHVRLARNLPRGWRPTDLVWGDVDMNMTAKDALALNDKKGK